MPVSQAARLPLRPVRCLHRPMAGERMVPLLPCAAIDVIAEFVDALGFEVTYRQTRPNPYLALRREGIEVHYFGMDGFRPEDSYGTCVVVSPDPKALFDDFAAGLRARYGRLPLAGFPRITRPRRRKNADGFTGFSLVDPGGNWIRVTAAQPEDDAGESDGPQGRLARALDDAVVLGDSHGDVDQAAKVLAGAARGGRSRRTTAAAAPTCRSRRSPSSAGPAGGPARATPAGDPLEVLAPASPGRRRLSATRRRCREPSRDRTRARGRSATLVTTRADPVAVDRPRLVAATPSRSSARSVTPRPVGGRHRAVLDGTAPRPRQARAATGPDAPCARGRSMPPPYLTRFSLHPGSTRLGEAHRQPEDRRKAASQYIESVGGKLHGFWYAFGAHDGMTSVGGAGQRVDGRGGAGDRQRRAP